MLAKESNSDSFDLTDHFLLAMPAMVDPNFNGTVVYVVEHNPKGAMGIVINRPMEMNLSGLFKKIDLTLQEQVLANAAVLLGGPVQNDRGFVLHSPVGEWSSSIKINATVALTSSRDVLEAVAAGTGPAQVTVALGYAGWGAGQIESEIAQNAWLSVKADPAVLFDNAIDARLQNAFKRLGIDPVLLSTTVGHA
jgi:putative transcriptional regulator